MLRVEVLKLDFILNINYLTNPALQPNSTWQLNGLGLFRHSNYVLLKLPSGIQFVTCKGSWGGTGAGTGVQELKREQEEGKRIKTAKTWFLAPNLVFG